MKIKNNQALNKVFLIMGVFSITMLVAGFQMGFDFHDSVKSDVEVEEESTIKAITVNDNSLYESLVPKLTILDATNPVHCYYTIENVTNAEIYVEKVKIKVFNDNNRQIYSTNVSLYKTYAPNEKDKIIFQIPKSPDNIASIDIQFE